MMYRLQSMYNHMVGRSRVSSISLYSLLHNQCPINLNSFKERLTVVVIAEFPCSLGHPVSSNNIKLSNFVSEKKLL